MKVKDLIEKADTLNDDVILKSALIALDAHNGRILFDTTKNKKIYIRKYLNGEILALWSDVRYCKGIGYGDYFKPVTKCYVKHNSWEGTQDG